MWNGVLFEEIIDMQATMFQPVGGHGPDSGGVRKESWESVVRRGCEVSEIKRDGPGCRDRLSHERKHRTGRR